MPIKIIAIIFFFLSNASSTNQEADKLLLDGKLIQIQAYRQTPFECFINKTYCNKIFRMNSTANYRGFIGQWSIINSELFLQSINIDNYNIPLNVFFDSNLPVKAYWYNGTILAIERTSDTINKFDYFTEYLFDINRGDIKETQSNKYKISTKDFALSKIHKDLKWDSLYTKYRNQNFMKLDSQNCKKTDSNFYINVLYKKIDSLKSAKYRYSQQVEISKILNLENSIDGINEFRLHFIQKNKSTLGLVNGYPFSIHYSIAPKQTSLISDIWLWMPIINNTLTSNYNEFIANFRDAEIAIEKYDWIKKWANKNNNREIQLLAYGNKSGVQFDNHHLPPDSLLKNFTFESTPKFHYYLRENSKVVGELFMFDSEDFVILSNFEISTFINYINFFDSAIAKNNFQFAKIDKNGIGKLIAQ